MTVIRCIAPAVICAAIATPFSADVTLHLKRTDSDVRGRVIDSTEYRKGAKVRTDSSGSSIASVSMIVDSGTGWVIMLRHDAKKAEVFDARKNEALLRKDGVAEVKPPVPVTSMMRSDAPVAFDSTSSSESVLFPILSGK